MYLSHIIHLLLLNIYCIHYCLLILIYHFDIQNFEDFKEVTKSIYSESDTDFADCITIGNFDDGNPETEFDEMSTDYFYGI